MQGQVHRLPARAYSLGSSFKHKSRGTSRRLDDCCLQYIVLRLCLPSRYCIEQGKRTHQKKTGRGYVVLLQCLKTLVYSFFFFSLSLFYFLFFFSFSFFLLFITFSISVYIMCVCLFSALNRRVGALQMSIIIKIYMLFSIVPFGQACGGGCLRSPVQVDICDLWAVAVLWGCFFILFFILRDDTGMLQQR